MRSGSCRLTDGWLVRFNSSPDRVHVLFDLTWFDLWRLSHRVAFNQAFAQLSIDATWDVELYGELLRIGGGKERMTHYFSQRCGVSRVSRDGDWDGDDVMRCDVHRSKESRLGDLQQGMAVCGSRLWRNAGACPGREMHWFGVPDRSREKGSSERRGGRGGGGKYKEPGRDAIQRISATVSPGASSTEDGAVHGHGALRSPAAAASRRRADATGVGCGNQRGSVLDVECKERKLGVVVVTMSIYDGGDRPMPTT